MQEIISVRILEWRMLPKYGSTQAEHNCIISSVLEQAPMTIRCAKGSPQFQLWPIKADSRSLNDLPVSTPLVPSQHPLFANHSLDCSIAGCSVNISLSLASAIALGRLVEGRA